jgi:hypothetical protein
MSIRLRRKLYPRGGSYETTIPLQLLLALDFSKKQEAIFEFDPQSHRWFITFEEFQHSKRAINKVHTRGRTRIKHPQGDPHG